MKILDFIKMKLIERRIYKEEIEEFETIEPEKKD